MIRKHPLEWAEPRTVGRVVIDFDPDWDHPMESVIRFHPEHAVPFTVSDFQLENDTGEILAVVTGNYLARREVRLPEPVSLRRLTLRVLGTHGAYPVAVFGIGVYA